MSLRISHTGVRNGEYITASQSGKQCEGTIIQLKIIPQDSKVAYPPAIKYVNQLDDLTLREQFNHFPFFKNMNTSERKQWLLDNATTNDDLYMNNIPNLYIRFTKISFQKVTGKKREQLLTSEQIDILIRGNPNESDGYWPIDSVYQMFPRNPKSKSTTRHTLVFRPSNWSLYVDLNQTLSSFTGLLVSMDTGDIGHGQVGNEYDIYPVVVRDEMSKFLGDTKNKLAIVSTKHTSQKLTYERLTNILNNILTNEQIQSFNNVRKLIDWFPPSLHKSLIQKIIRIRPIDIEYANTFYDAKVVLLCSWCILLVHQGSFVPNIQKYVSGSEAALKRAAVSIIEDGYISDPRILTSLLAGSWVSQNSKNLNIEFNPSDVLLKTWILSLIECMDSDSMYEYNWHKSSKTIRDWNNWSMNYCLLDTIRSFQSDIDMVCSIYDNNGIKSEEKDIRGKKRTMPLIHCIDHHSFTDIGWFVKPDYCIKGYKYLFELIWNHNTGVNCRKDKYKKSPCLLMMQDDNLKDSDSSTIDFVNNIKEAQRLLWINKIHTPILRELMETNIEIDYTLDQSWIAALVGPIEIKLGNITAIAVIRPDNIYEFTAVKRPIRGTDDTPELTEEQREIAVKQLKEMLISGIKIDHCPSTLSDLKDAIILYREVGVTLEPVYYIAIVDSTEKTGYRVVLWSDYVKTKFIFNEHKDTIDPLKYLENACIYSGDGIETNHMNKLQMLL